MQPCFVTCGNYSEIARVGRSASSLLSTDALGVSDISRHHSGGHPMARLKDLHRSRVVRVGLYVIALTGAGSFALTTTSGAAVQPSLAAPIKASLARSHTGSGTSGQRQAV